MKCCINQDWRRQDWLVLQAHRTCAHAHTQKHWTHTHTWSACSPATNPTLNPLKLYTFARMHALIGECRRSGEWGWGGGHDPARETGFRVAILGLTEERGLNHIWHTNVHCLKTSTDAQTHTEPDTFVGREPSAVFLENLSWHASGETQICHLLRCLLPTLNSSSRRVIVSGRAIENGRSPVLWWRERQPAGEEMRHEGCRWNGRHKEQSSGETEAGTGGETPVE